MNRHNAARFATFIGTAHRNPRCRARCERFIAAVIVSGVLFATNASAGDDGSRLPEHDEWIVYGGPELSIFGHTVRGRTSASELTGPRVAVPSEQLGDLGTAVVDDLRNREAMLSFLLGGTIGVLTPAIDLPSHPRFFVDLNLSVPLGTEVQLNRFANPGPISFSPELRNIVPTGEGALPGNGNQVTAQHQGPQVHAAFGPSFEIPLGPDQRLRLKPGVVYSRMIVDVTALTARAVRLNNDSGLNNGIEDYRIISLGDSRTEVYHAVGPLIEVDYDPGIEWGPIRLGLYGKVHAGYIFGDLVTAMQQSNPDFPDETVRWRFIQDRWIYRAGTGIRIFWSPKF